MHFTKLFIGMGLFVLGLPFTPNSTSDLNQASINAQETNPEGKYAERAAERIFAELSRREARIRNEFAAHADVEARAQQDLESFIRESAQTQQAVNDLSRQETELRQQIERNPFMASIFQPQLEDVGKRRAEAMARNEGLRPREFQVRSAFNNARQAYLNAAANSGAELVLMGRRQKEIRELLAGYEKGANPAAVLPLLQRSIAAATVEDDIKSNVHLKVNGAPPATVKYQLEDSTDIQTAKCEPECDEEMFIGVYFIWSERNSRATSAKNKYTIVDEKEAVTINEDR